MGYDFKPRRKDVDWFHLGAFSFGWMLDDGPGLVIGYDEGIKTASFVYIPDAKGKCPMYNEGYYIKSKEAKLIAFLLRKKMGIVKFRNNEWESLSDDEKKWIEKFRPHRSGAIREDFIEKAYKFADWLEICGGCWIY